MTVEPQGEMGSGKLGLINEFEMVPSMLQALDARLAAALAANAAA